MPARHPAKPDSRDSQAPRHNRAVHVPADDGRESLSTASAERIVGEVSAGVLKAIENGAGTWSMLWTTTGFEFPINPTTRKHYRGGNVLTFAAEAIGKGFTSGEWATSSNRPRSVVRFVRSNTAPRVSGGASPPPRRPTRRPAVVTTVMVDECTPANRRCHRAFACPRQRASGRSRTANDGPAFRRVAAGCGGLRRGSRR